MEEVPRLSVPIQEATVLAHIQQALIVTNASYEIIRIDGAFQPIFHLSADRFIGADVRTLIFEGQINEIMQRLEKGQSSVMIRDINVGEDLPNFETMDVGGVPLSDTGHYLLTFSPRKMSGQVTDITSDLSGAVMTIKGLSAMLAHEIKNPLSGIKGAAQLLERKIDEKSKKLTTMMVNEVDRISRLVNDLETFTNPEVSLLEPVNVHVVLDQAIDNLSAGLGQSIRFDRLYDPSLPPVMGSYDALVQIFLNIIKNSVEASEQGSTIKIKTNYQHSLWLRDEQGERKKLPIEVVIEDEGPGISPEIKSHLFDPFITNKEGGSGLGLAVVAQNMMAMGAIIKCEDNDPSGTNMHLYFQAA
ncbi:ATP-binding protein [Temperatibacter marinus]|uniref:histidine kinase n=1 Tax=Temperatibacter marinus TaxID=1456591 RepID=A0AA52EHC0_9PROT|nr:ATP-binding protein [Temperatibacter marinus]WND02324.1 ATP-binding protein [Temperatibacter marinus]